MYLPGQIVYNLDSQKPIQVPDSVWDRRWYAKNPRTVRFVKYYNSSSERALGGLFLTLVATVLPKSVEEAEEQLYKGIIQPAPYPPDHCWKCHQWLRDGDNHNNVICSKCENENS